MRIRFLYPNRIRAEMLVLFALMCYGCGAFDEVESSEVGSASAFETIAKQLESKGSTADAVLAYIAALQLSDKQDAARIEHHLESLQCHDAQIILEMRSLGWQFCFGKWSKGLPDKQSFSTQDGLLVCLARDIVTTGVTVNSEAHVEHYVGFLAHEREKVIALPHGFGESLLRGNDRFARAARGFGYIRSPEGVQYCHAGDALYLGERMVEGPLYSKILEPQPGSGLVDLQIRSSRSGLSIQGMSVRIIPRSKQITSRPGAVLFRVFGAATVNRPYVEVEDEKEIVSKLFGAKIQYFSEERRESQYYVFANAKNGAEFKKCVVAAITARGGRDPIWLVEPLRTPECLAINTDTSVAWLQKCLSFLGTKEGHVSFEPIESSSTVPGDRSNVPASPVGPPSGQKPPPSVGESGKRAEEQGK